jgi:hypothetical protein
MMRVLMSLLLLSGVVSGDAFGASRHRKMPHCMSNEAWNRLAGQLEKHPPYITPARLPRGSKIGRCLLVVKGKRLIDGNCAYSIEKDGSFGFDGPRQIYPGIDYPECFTGAATFTTDYFVQVDWVNREELDDGSPGPGWEASWNGAIGSNHAEAFLGSVRRHGSCYANSEAKICLWRK